MKLSSDPRHALNAICPYFTMFPLEYPIGILKRRPAAKRILDPFCGRGTTLYAARWHGRDSWGIDASPVAVAIARAKLASPEIMDVLDLAFEILDAGRGTEIPSGDFWSLGFHPETLSDLCRLRAGLAKRRSDSAAILTGVVLGCLHGPLTKNPDDPSYFSNQMPRTFAPKPEYAVSYWRKHKLAPRYVDVLDVIAKKALRLPVEELPNAGNTGQVVKGNSQDVRTYTTMPWDFDTVITSPPYYGMVNYVQDQWLRNWFLGGADRPDYKKTDQLDTDGPDGFALALAEVWDNVGGRLARNGRMFIRFGSIPSRDIDPRELLCTSLGLSRHNWKVATLRSAKSAEAGRRQATLMHRSNAAAVVEYDAEVDIS